MRIAVVEDEERYMKQTVGDLQKYAAEEDADFEISTFSNGLEFLDKFSCGRFDLVFMDIKMPNSNGMGVARDIRTLDADVGIIFLTNLTQYAIKGYEVEALDYLVKPIEYSAFKLKLARAIRRLKKREGAFITITTKSELKKIPVNNIVYVESLGHRAIFHLLDGEETVWKSMAEIEEMLSRYHFSRCNNSYCVNLKYVESVQSASVKIGKEELKISRGRYKGFMDDLTVFFSSGGEG